MNDKNLLLNAIDDAIFGRGEIGRLTNLKAQHQHTIAVLEKADRLGGTDRAAGKIEKLKAAVGAIDGEIARLKAAPTAPAASTPTQIRHTPAASTPTPAAAEFPELDRYEDLRDQDPHEATRYYRKTKDEISSQFRKRAKAIENGSYKVTAAHARRIRAEHAAKSPAAAAAFAREWPEVLGNVQ